VGSQIITSYLAEVNTWSISFRAKEQKSKRAKEQKSKKTVDRF
jgi:hypothetical protein